MQKVEKPDTFCPTWMKTRPYAHQLDVWERSRDLREFALFLEMGTGKSKVLLDTAAHLALAGRIDGALIIAPKGVYANWVEQEIPRHLSDSVKRDVYLWSAATSQRAQREREAILHTANFAICVMNVEALSGKRGLTFATKFLTERRALLAVDESTTVKNPSAARTKATIKLGRLAEYRRILTGSPVTRAPLDVYSQMQVLRPGLLGFSSFYTFRNRYAEMETDFVRSGAGLRQFKTVSGYRRLDELHQKLADFSARILKADCLDLPPKTYLRRTVDLTKEQHTAYKEMLTESITLLDGIPATATAVITQILRCHQILCGHLPTIDGEVRELPHNRLDALLETLEEGGGQAIVWANYRHDIEAITARLNKVYGPGSARSYYGETPQADRQQIVEDFQAGRLKYFVGQQRTGGYGLTLTAANLVVYFSNSFDLETRLQSEDRAHRIGQTQPVTYVDLLVPGTIDEKIVRALRSKIDLAGQVTGDGWREWLC